MRSIIILLEYVLKLYATVYIINTSSRIGAFRPNMNLKPQSLMKYGFVFFYIENV